MDKQVNNKYELPPILSVPELGEFLGIGRNSAYDLVRSNQIQSLHIGRKIRVPRHAVLEYIGAHD